MKKKRIGVRMSHDQIRNPKRAFIGALNRDRRQNKKRSNDEMVVIVRKSNSVAVKSARGVDNPRAAQGGRVVIKREGVRTTRGMIKPIGSNAVRGKSRVNQKAYGGGRNKPDFDE